MGKLTGYTQRKYNTDKEKGTSTLSGYTQRKYKKYTEEQERNKTSPSSFKPLKVTEIADNLGLKQYPMNTKNNLKKPNIKFEDAPVFQNKSEESGAAFKSAALDSASLGLAGLLRKGAAKLGGSEKELKRVEEAERTARENNPIQSIAGTAVGYITPGMGFAKAGGVAARGILKASGKELLKSTAIKAGEKTLQKVIEGTAGATGMALTESIFKGENSKQQAKRLDTDIKFGLAGEAVGAVGGALMKTLPKKIKAKKVVEEAVQGRSSLPTEELKPQASVKLPLAKKPPLNASQSVKKTIAPKSDIPIPQGQKERSFPQNVQGSSDVPKTVSAKLKKERLTYEPITNKGTLDKVAEQVKLNPYEALTKFLSQEGKKGLTADDVATGELFIKKAFESGNDQQAHSLISTLAEKLTEAGQAVQAASMFKRMTPEGMLLYAERMVGKGNRDLFNRLGNKAKKIKLTEHDSKFITDTMKKFQSMPDGRAKDIELAKVMQHISNKIPASNSEKALAIQRVSLLLNPKSMIRNVLGNTLFGTVDNISNTVATPIDALVGKVTGKRTTTLPSITGQLKSGLKGVKETIEDAKLGIDTSPSRSQFDLPNKKMFHGNDVLNKTLNKLDTATKVGLQIGDRPFYQAAYDDVLRQQMKLNKVTEPTTEMIEQAHKIAQQRTYQDINSLTKAFKKAQSALNLGKPIGLGNVVLPFVKTPANILKRAIEYSPIGVEKAVREAYQLIRNTGKFDQKAFVDSIARSVTGTGLIMVGYDLAKKGVITGSGNKDKDVAAFERNLGKNDYAFKVGDNYYTYDWMQPASMAMAIGADMHLHGQDRKQAENVAIDAIKSGGQTLFKQSLLQGVQRFMGGFSPMDNLEQTAINAPTMLVPTLSRQIAQLTDKTQRNTYATSNVDSGINQIKNRIPGLSKTLQPKIDTFGNTMQNYQGKNNIGNVMLNPGIGTKFKPTPVQKEILRLYNQIGDKDIFPKVAPKSLQYKGQSVQLTPEDITKFQQTMGKLTDTGMSNIINNNIYSQIADEVKAKRLRLAIDKAYESAKLELLQRKGLIK
jgi:hypothetical protein